jgi:DNA polymerase III delta prime subunit
LKIVDNKHYIWAEKYRPQCIEDLIIPDFMKAQMSQWVEDGQIPNLGIWGNTPGLGKTSLTNALIKDLDASVLWKNASGDGGIDTMREEIPPFAGSVTHDGRPKIVVLDEADNLTVTVNGAQYNLRGSIEKYAKNCRFILTGNYQEKVIKPIINRLSNFDFDEIFAKHKKELGASIYHRLTWILENENITYEKTDVQKILKNFYPSIREMTMFMQKSIVENHLVLDEKYTGVDKIKEDVINTIRNNDFKQMLKLSNDLTDPSSLFTYIYKHMKDMFPDESIPHVIILLSDYMDMASRSRDEHINCAAFCVKMMMHVNIKFKEGV